MEYTLLFALLAVLVASSLCSGAARTSYTDTLLRGLKRRPSVLPLTGGLSNGLANCNCPLGTECVVIGVGVTTCRPSPVVGVGAGLDVGSQYANAVGQLGAGLVNPHAGPVNTGYVGGVFDGLVHNNAIIASQCGVLRPGCLASVNDFNPTWKFTFDSSINSCVGVQVCQTCAGFNGRLQNLFDTENQCRLTCLGNF